MMLTQVHTALHCESHMQQLHDAGDSKPCDCSLHAHLNCSLTVYWVVRAGTDYEGDIESGSDDDVAVPSQPGVVSQSDFVAFFDPKLAPAFRLHFWGDHADGLRAVSICLQYFNLIRQCVSTFFLWTNCEHLSLNFC